MTGEFEALSDQIADLSKQMRDLIVEQWIQIGLLLVVAAAVLAPYLAPLGSAGRLGP